MQPPVVPDGSVNDGAAASRYHALDALRGVMMLGGVVLVGESVLRAIAGDGRGAAHLLVRIRGRRRL